MKGGNIADDAIAGESDIPEVQDKQREAFKAQPPPEKHPEMLFLCGEIAEDNRIPYHYRVGIGECLARYKKEYPGTIGLSDVWEKAVRMEIAIWAVLHEEKVQAAGVSRFVPQYDGIGSVLEINCAGAHPAASISVKAWAEAVTGFFEILAGKMQCSKISITGRKGWKKLLRDYKPEDTVILSRTAPFGLKE